MFAIQSISNLAARPNKFPQSYDSAKMGSCSSAVEGNKMGGKLSQVLKTNSNILQHFFSFKTADRLYFISSKDRGITFYISKKIKIYCLRSRRAIEMAAYLITMFFFRAVVAAQLVERLLPTP